MSPTNFADSADAARQLFEWLIAPTTVEDFYENYWEKKPLLIAREDRTHYDGFFSKEPQRETITPPSSSVWQDAMDTMLREEELIYGQVLPLTGSKCTGEPGSLGRIWMLPNMWMGGDSH